MKRKLSPNKIAVVLFLFFITIFTAISQTVPKESEFEYLKLLDGYLKNDSKTKELSIKLSQAENSLQKTMIQKSVDMTLSSGDISVKAGSESTSLSVSPSATVSIPAANNSEIKVTVPASTTIGTNSSEKISLSGAGASFSTDIISSANAEMKVALEKSQRSVLEAQRNLDLRKIAAEKEFLTELKSLYESYSKVLTLKNTLIEKTSSFETVKIQGFNSTSAKYRTAFLAVKSAERDVEEQNREFLRLLSVFSSKCNVSLDKLPSDIPSVTLENINDYDPSLFTSLENSVWANDINIKARKASSDLKLTGSVGYSYAEKTTTTKTTEAIHNAELGASLSFKGINIATKVSVPVNKPDTTSASLSISIQKNSAKLSSLEKENENFTAQLEELAISNAKESYKTEVTSREKKYGDLTWQKAQNEEQLSLYRELADDTAVWYKQGLVTESDYQSALTDFERAQITSRTTELECLIYNLEIKSLFYIF